MDQDDDDGVASVVSDGEDEDHRGDADDENEEDDEDDEDEVETEEEEPRLKYQRMGGSVPVLLSADTASCIGVSERMIALGTHGGTVHLLDYLGNQVREFRVHKSTVNEVSFDGSGEFVASCSDDRSVVVNGLFTNEREKFEYQRPMKSVALDPDYARARSFAVGGLSGQLILNSRGWFGSRDQVLHSGEGPIHAVKWRTSLIAWANDRGVKIFDTALQQRLAYIEKPEGGNARADHSRPNLVWQDDSILLTGWGNVIQVAVVRYRDAVPVNRRLPLLPDKKFVEIVATLHTDYTISGLAPFGEALVVLAYIDKEEDKVERSSSNTYSPKTQTGHAQRPEVCILTWKEEELASDALPVHGFEHYKSEDYALAHAPFSGSSSAGGQWTAGDEPLFFIVSPKDVVLARQRDADDHVQWLLEHGWHEKALAAVEASNARTELLDEVGSQYLDHLILERRYAQAASLCPQILRGSASAWERWVISFGQLRNLHVLAPYIPTSNPQLRDTIYEVVLDAFLINPTHHELFLQLVRTWPKSIYSVPKLISSIEAQCDTGPKSQSLKEALADLYLFQKQYAKVLQLYLELGKKISFEFIEKYQLYDALHGKIHYLLKIDSESAISVLIQQRKRITAGEVVSELEKLCQEERSRRPLHEYLHALFERDPDAGQSYHGLQVELYAEYEPRLLLPFLRSSQYYKLDKALDVSTRRGLVKERVYILGRMGNTKDALALIINNLKSMEDAIEFVNSQNDEDLREELVRQSLRTPEMAGALLEHTSGIIEPLDLINKIPKDMLIPSLRDRLVKILSDCRTEASLRKGCNNILKVDRINLLRKYYDEARRGIRPQRGCCVCSDALAFQSVAVAVFFCNHCYHSTCTTRSSSTNGSSSSKDLERCSFCMETQKIGNPNEYM